MKFNRMFKFSLCALLLAASGSAFAEDDATLKEVLLKDKTTYVSWDDFVSVLNGTKPEVSETLTEALTTARNEYFGVDGTWNNPKLPGARKDSIDAVQRYRTAKSNYDIANGNNQDWTAQLTQLNNQPSQPIKWLKDAYDAAVIFNDALDYYYENEKDKTNPPVIYYKLSGTASTAKRYLTISFLDPNETGYTSLKPSEFENQVIEDNSISVYGVYIYLGKDGDKFNYGKQISEDQDATGRLKVSYTPGNLIDNKYTSGKGVILTNAVDALSDLIKSGEYDTNAKLKQELLANLATLTANAKDSEGNPVLVDGKPITQLKYLYNLYLEAETAKDEKAEAAVAALKNLQSKEGEYNAALAAMADNYDEVTLNANVTATTPIAKAFTGSIDANGNIITIQLPAGTTYLFSNFANGHLENAIVNGKFAARGSFVNTAVWRGSDGTYYNADGNIGNIVNIGELAYKVRSNEFFSADIDGNKLVKWSEDSQVYDITLYQPNATTQFYTNIENGVFVNNPISEVSANAFYVSKTNDFGDIANVIVGNVCENVVIKDKESFYCPFDITAKNVTLNRSLNAGYNTVCLPFEMTYTNMGLGANDLLCKYDKETTTKFWFTKTQTVDANTPALIYLAEAKPTTTLIGVTIKKTENQIVNFEGAVDDKSQACGLFKNVTADDIRGGSNAVKVYGLQGGAAQQDPNNPSATFNPAGKANFAAFRMVIVSELAATQAEQGQPLTTRGIGVVDEKGIEINVGGGLAAVEIVDMESASLDIKAGNGEIIITTDANYGTQTVYSLDGKAVATVNVVEGTNTVNVPSGFYVVMGQKVLVK